MFILLSHCVGASQPSRPQCLQDHGQLLLCRPVRSPWGHSELRLLRPAPLTGPMQRVAAAPMQSNIEHCTVAFARLQRKAPKRGGTSNFLLASEGNGAPLTPQGGACRRSFKLPPRSWAAAPLPAQSEKPRGAQSPPIAPKKAASRPSHKALADGSQTPPSSWPQPQCRDAEITAPPKC